MIKVICDECGEEITVNVWCTDAGKVFAFGVGSIRFNVATRNQYCSRGCAISAVEKRDVYNDAIEIKCEVCGGTIEKTYNEYVIDAKGTEKCRPQTQYMEAGIGDKVVHYCSARCAWHEESGE